MEQAAGQEKMRILFVEDDPGSMELFVDCFEEEYSIVCAMSGEEALDIFAEDQDFSMVLSDQAMPGMSGVALLTHIYARRPDIIRIIITGFMETTNVIEAINRVHIYQFILKPWDIVQMRMILKQAAKSWNLVRENNELQQKVLSQNSLLTDANEQLYISEKSLRNLSTALLSAQEDEQKRISMELHDDLGQQLAALKLQIGVMRNELGSGDKCSRKKVSGWLDRLRDDINQVIEDVRRLSKNLSPLIIDDLGLDAAIENIVKQFTSTNAVTCSFRPVSLADITSAIGQRMIYRLIQESLNNISKHAEASHIDFTINIAGEECIITLADNGNGFDYEEIINRPPEHKGIGLTAMRERAKMLGGSLDIESDIGMGTTVSVTIPLDSNLIETKKES